jgi:protein phosphatase
VRRLHLDGGGYSHPGRRRTNADVWAATCRRAVLSDGAGMWGVWAAHEAVQAAMHSPPGCLVAAVRSAHAAVGDVDAGALATLVAIEVLGPDPGRAAHGDGRQCLEVANVGDSRCLLAAADGRVEWLTELHNGAAELAREGVIAVHEVATHPFRHRLTRSLGGSTAEPDVAAITVGPGDRIVLVTDGVHGALDAATLDRLARAGSPPAAAESMVLTAFEAGATDNITAVVVEVVGVGAGGDAG